MLLLFYYNISMLMTVINFVEDTLYMYMHKTLERDV